MEKRSGNLLGKVDERLAQEELRSVQLGKEAGSRIFDDYSNGRFGSQTLSEILHEAQAGFSETYASAIWPGYVGRAREVFKQEQRS